MLVLNKQHDILPHQHFTVIPRSKISSHVRTVLFQRLAKVSKIVNFFFQEANQQRSPNIVAFNTEKKSDWNIYFIYIILQSLRYSCCQFQVSSTYLHTVQLGVHTPLWQGVPKPQNYQQNQVIPKAANSSLINP